MDLIIKEEEIREIEKEVQQTEEKKLKNLEIASKQLNDVINESPQQLPIVFLIKKELKQFQANININNSNILEDLNLNQSNAYNLSNDNIRKINEQCKKIYDIFNKMYLDYFYFIIIKYINNDRFQKLLIFNIIADSDKLSDLIDKQSQQSNMTKEGWWKKNTPKYWPLRIREALVSILEFKIEAEFKEAIDYFETNCMLFIFISKLKKMCNELNDAYNLLFDCKNRNKGSNFTKRKKMIIDNYIHRKLCDIENPKSCSRFIESINSSVNFDIFPNKK